jgi:hypothetical protein
MNSQQKEAWLTAAKRLDERTSESENQTNSTNSTKDVIENHIRSFREGNLDALLDYFAPDAVLFTHSGTLRGRSEIKNLFQHLLDEFEELDASETVRTAIFDGEYAYLIWSGETPYNRYEFATDTFIVRNGKIVAQSFAAKITPKHKPTPDVVPVLFD